MAATDPRAALGGDLAPATAEPAPPRARGLDIALGAALLATFTAIGAASTHAQRLIPGTVAGFVALTLSLALVERHARLHRVVTRGLVPLARLLLRHMGLLFVPAGVVGLDGVLTLPDRDAASVAAALVVSTLAALFAAALLMARRPG